MNNQVTISGTTVSLSNAYGNKLAQQAILAAEMQVVAASLFDGVSEIAHISSIVASASKSSRAVRYVVARTGVDVPALLDKLNALPQAALLAINHGISQYRTMSASEMFGLDRLPSLATLTRLGLVKARGQAAWGFAVVQLNDSRTCELVLRQDPTTTGVGQLPYSLDHASAGIVKLVRSLLDGETVPKGRQIALGLGGLVALHTGWRNFRVEESNDCVVVEISRNDLLGDLYRGELGGLVLQGLNAPEVPLA